MHNKQIKQSVTILERIVMFLIYTNIPLLFVIKGFIKSEFSWDKVNIFNKVSISYSILLIIMIILQIIFKRGYLSIIFGCHELEERSFKFVYKYLYICARCTGILAGIFLMVIVSSFKINMNLLLFGLVPMLIDGLVQRFTEYKSNNIRRFITGILAGLAIMVLTSYYYLLLAKLVLWVSSLFV